MEAKTVETFDELSTYQAAVDTFYKLGHKDDTNWIERLVYDGEFLDSEMVIGNLNIALVEQFVYDLINLRNEFKFYFPDLPFTPFYRTYFLVEVFKDCKLVNLEEFTEKVLNACHLADLSCFKNRTVKVDVLTLKKFVCNNSMRWYEILDFLNDVSKGAEN